MKKLVLLFLIPFTMLMADFTLNGKTLTPLNEDTVVPSTTTNITNSTPTTYTTPNTSTTGTAKTNWGFQPFSVPSASVTVPAGGDIQAAINSLPNGGTINLEAGEYIVQRLDFNSNTVLQGAGKHKTKLKTKDNGTWPIYTSGGHVIDGIKNIILRNFELDGNMAGGATRGGINFAYGVSNLLFENIYIHDILQNGININNGVDKSRGYHVTFRNITAERVGWQPISLRFVNGVIIDNVTADTVGMAFDFSAVTYGEISNLHADLKKFTGYGTFAKSGGGAINGAKIQGSKYIYVHDTTIKNAILVGIKLTEGSYKHYTQYLHLEDVTIENSGKGIGQFGDVTTPNTYQEIVVKNVNLVNNYFNPACWTTTWKPVAGCKSTDGDFYPNIRVKGAVNVYEYGKKNLVVAIPETTIGNRVYKETGNPENDKVGWKSWGNP